MGAAEQPPSAGAALAEGVAVAEAKADAEELRERATTDGAAEGGEEKLEKPPGKVVTEEGEVVAESEATAVGENVADGVVVVALVAFDKALAACARLARPTKHTAVGTVEPPTKSSWQGLAQAQPEALLPKDGPASHGGVTVGFATHDVAFGWEARQPGRFSKLHTPPTEAVKLKG